MADRKMEPILGRLPTSGFQPGRVLVVSLVYGNRPDAWCLPKVTSQITQSPGAIGANAAFVAAHAAGRAAVAESLDHGSYQAGFAAERTWQLAKFAELLG